MLCNFVSFSAEEMFNRTREMARITEVLLSTPQLSIITGLVNSGKTLLLEKVFDQLPEKSTKPTPVYPINLRKGSFHSVQSLVSSLSSGMNSWMKTITQNADLSFNAAGLKLQFKPLSNCNPIDELNHLLEKVTNLLPSTTLLRGSQLPILYIDKANRLQTILRDKDGQAALETLFEWLIMHTKEKNHFHMVLSSSDSFFALWAEKFIGPTRYSTYVLGHLDKTEAQRNWNMLIKTNEALLKVVEKTPDFTEAFSVCGGSIFLLNMFT